MIALLLAITLPVFEPSKALPKPKPYLQSITGMTWTVESPATNTTPFKFENNVLTITTAALTPARTTVRTLLPGDGPANGDVWAKYKANYIAFRCRSSQPVALTFHPLQRGKSAGTYHAGFSAGPEWQTIVLPVEQFGLKNFAKVAGFGFRAVAGNAEVSVTDFTVGTTPFTDDTGKITISLNGDWGFSNGTERILKSGLSWQEQGVDHAGWGYYWQKLFVPKEAAGLPMTLTLVPIPSDDEVWFNDTHVGGFSSEYKYNNWITRVYTVPPALIRYGETNALALRIWGGNLTFIGNKSGLVKGPLTAEFSPVGVEVDDLSDAQQGKPFHLAFRFPAELNGKELTFQLSDYVGNAITNGTATIAQGRVVVTPTPQLAQTFYLRGRFRARLLVTDAGKPLYVGSRDVDHISFAKRDTTPLAALPEKMEDTPYGKLKLVDEIDCATSLFDEPHPYLQSGFDKVQDRMTPGSPVEVKVTEILGKKARESAYGWFAYRIGRGKLKPHSTYLLRIEYPEDKPRFCPIEIQTGQNYMDVGWKGGVGPADVYDNWPLSQQWQWYDVIVPLDDQTVGTGGTGTAPAENGFWVYFMNKLKPGAYYAMWSGGPAVARMKLYEIDPVKNAPVIHRPDGLPQRVLSFDWERGADHDPADFVRYAKLMGYNAISPIILKWFFANYSEPLAGYETISIDERDYWARGLTGRKSEHVRYLEATKQLGLNYIPRFEWGGSQDLPQSAWAVDVNGSFTKPNRFAPWCANLLNPLTWDDLKKWMDHLVGQYVKDNPQLTGALWRIRCSRLPPSYGKADLELFSKETGLTIPGGESQWATWVIENQKDKYDDWWHRKRAEFHGKLAKLLQSYRPDLTLYYFNWDPDKFGMIEPDITAWAFVANVVKPAPDGGRAAYEKERAVRKKFTAADYIYTMHSGNFGRAFRDLNRADQGIRPELYRDIKGFQIFAPANYLCYADKPEFLNYFQTADGLAVANVVSYDEVGARTINPKYEGNMITPGGAPFSMALELLPYFHGDARTLNYTVYTYGRGFADVHRRFAQAFLALPAVEGKVIESGDPDVKIRVYADKYVGIAYKGYVRKKLAIKLPFPSRNLVTDQDVPAEFELETGPMELHAFRRQ